MIAAAVSWGEAPAFDAARMAQSLGLFAGGAAQLHARGRAQVAQLAGPRRARQPGWAPHVAEDGHVVLVEGVLDNQAELAARFGCAPATRVEAVYAAALARWGDEADRHCIGDYASLAIAPDGALRMARSPWTAPTLFCATGSGGVAVASVPRPLFAGGHPRRLRPGQLADLLYWIENAGAEHWYEGVLRVPQGSVVHVDRGGHRILRWYDPLALPDQRLPHDDDYVARADALLSDAARAALAPAAWPGLLLGGGLDSAIVADELLRHLPAAQRLRSYTFVPLPRWAGASAPGLYADDRGRVEAFAAMHPRLDPRFCDNDGLDFDGHAEAFFLATDAGRPAQAINAAYFGPLGAAAADGCDWVFDAALGNNAFSNDGRWAYVEFARTGRWAEAWRMARDHPGDRRPMWRRMVARTLVPQLPAPVRAALRRFVHGRPPDLMGDLTLLRPGAIAALGLERRARQAGTWRSGEFFRTREEWLRFVWPLHDMGGEWRHGIEQVFGLRHRDVSGYRPLVEFCAGVPTDQFVRGGVQRWLARRMAAGRMPEAQRLGTDYGRHNVDWHLRLTRRLPELRAEFERMKDDPELAALIDVDAGLALLARWPREEPVAPHLVRRHFHALTGAVIAARFHRFASGSNR